MADGLRVIMPYHSGFIDSDKCTTLVGLLTGEKAVYIYRRRVNGKVLFSSQAFCEPKTASLN